MTTLAHAIRSLVIINICNHCGHPTEPNRIFFVGACWVRAKQTVMRGSQKETIYTRRPFGHKIACSGECKQAIERTEWFATREMDIAMRYARRDNLALECAARADAGRPERVKEVIASFGTKLSTWPIHPEVGYLMQKKRVHRST